MSTRQLDEHEMSVIRALVRDVVATIGLKDEAAFTDSLMGFAAQAKRSTWAREGLQAFESYVVDEVQQQLHDGFVDVSWPRCPRHPNHPLWLENGWWRCTKENVSLARLGELAAMSRPV